MSMSLGRVSGKSFSSLLGEALEGEGEEESEMSYKSRVLAALQKLNTRDTQKTASTQLMMILEQENTLSLPHFLHTYMVIVSLPFVTCRYACWKQTTAKAVPTRRRS